MVIGTPGSSAQASDYHFIHTSRIGNFQIDARNPTASASFPEATPSIGPVDFKEAEKREAQAIAAEKEKAQRRKQGVTAEGEEIFTAIERM